MNDEAICPLFRQATAEGHLPAAGAEGRCHGVEPAARRSPLQIELACTTTAHRFCPVFTAALSQAHPLLAVADEGAGRRRFRRRAGLVIAVSLVAAALAVGLGLRPGGPLNPPPSRSAGPTSSGGLLPSATTGALGLVPTVSPRATGLLVAGPTPAPTLPFTGGIDSPPPTPRPTAKPTLQPTPRPTTAPRPWWWPARWDGHSDLNCSDFASYAAVQTFWDRMGFSASRDPYNLDGNGDGRPCWYEG